MEKEGLRLHREVAPALTIFSEARNLRNIYFLTPVVQETKNKRKRNCLKNNQHPQNKITEQFI